MPLGQTTFGGGASGADPIPPSLSGLWTYENIVAHVRLFSHTSGNTTAITNGEILAIVVDIVKQIVKENWEKMSPNYLQTNTFNIIGSSNPYKVDYSALSPYMERFVGAMFLQGTTRHHIKMVSADELERRSKMTTVNANSVLGTQYDGFIDLFVGSFITTPQDYDAEIYYFRQPKTSGITTTNYATEYVDLPDSYIPQLVDMAVLQVERTKQ